MCSQAPGFPEGKPQIPRLRVRLTRQSASRKSNADAPLGMTAFCSARVSVQRQANLGHKAQGDYQPPMTPEESYSAGLVAFRMMLSGGVCAGFT